MQNIMELSETELDHCHMSMCLNKRLGRGRHCRKEKGVRLSASCIEETLNVVSEKSWGLERGDFFFLSYIFAVPKVFVISMTFSKINHVCLYIYKTKATQRKYRQKRKGETWLALSTLLPASCAITQQATAFCNFLVWVAPGLLWKVGTSKAVESGANSPLQKTDSRSHPILSGPYLLHELYFWQILQHLLPCSFTL